MDTEQLYQGKFAHDFIISYVLNSKKEGRDWRIWNIFNKLTRIIMEKVDWRGVTAPKHYLVFTCALWRD